MAVKVNQDAVEHAKNLIRGRQYESESDWSEARPSTAEENEFIEQGGWEAFASWHLAYDDEETERTKQRYRFPFGDLKKLHRSGLIAAEQRAGKESYTEVERVTRELLEEMPQGG